MVEDMIVMALNELFDKIDEENDAIEEKLAGRGGLDF